MHPTDCSARICLVWKVAWTLRGKMISPVKVKVRFTKNSKVYKSSVEILCLQRQTRIDKCCSSKPTAKVIVDSAFRTSTKTSAFRQWLSIQSSRLGETSTPGESMKTTSSRRRLHRSLGQNIRINDDSFNFSWHKAFANCLMFWKREKEMKIKLWTYTVFGQITRTRVNFHGLNCANLNEKN